MYGMVIDSMGYGVELVHIFNDGEIDAYDLKDGESIITKGWRKATSMNKPRWNFDTEEWGETEPIEPPQIDNCPPKTVEERLAEAEQKLAESEEEKKLLKAQVEVLSNTTDFHEELIAEMASKVYA